MPRFKLTLEYDGTPYRGWQMNKGEITVQGKLLEACDKVFTSKIKEIYGAGRTDAGVHAIAQVAHLEVDTNLKPHQIRMKLNDELPHSINILNVESVPGRFHARHDATARSYVYIISKRRSAFFKKNVWWIKDPLNVNSMRDASKVFPGLKDFRSFGRPTGKEESTKVEIKHIAVHELDSTIMIHIVGSHFLWNQVRRMVGVLVEAGRENISTNQIERMMKTASDEPAKLTAPPSGLYLEHVYYDDEKFSVNPSWPVVVK